MYDPDHYPFPLKPLPYAYNCLQPAIDARTLHFHHDKHLKTYVDNLNKALKPYPAYHTWNLEMLLANINELPEEIRTPVWNNGGGVYHHQLYFDSMTGKRTSPDQCLQNAVARSFGSIEQWKKQMREAAASVFGSGWAWTVCDAAGQLGILTTANQDTVLPYCPLLPLDVWEHAYYLQYQNRRLDYVEKWFGIINWSVLNKRFQAQTKK